MTVKFDRVLWLGPLPKNSRREGLLRDLCQLLEFQGPTGNTFGPAAGVRQLALGNFEDWQQNSNAWPKPDGVEVYVGVFFTEPPSSGELLRLYDESHLSFILCDDAQVADLREALDDLLA